MGSFEEVYVEYGSDHKDLKRIKEKEKKIKDAIIVGSSQYGVYFRLVKKSIVEKRQLLKNDSDQFTQLRTFVFDFEKFIHYVFKETNEIPLFWYSRFNAYGYTKYGSVMLDWTVGSFLAGVADELHDKLYEHEFVCRISIPINDSSAGFLGKINFGILGLTSTNAHRYE